MRIFAFNIGAIALRQRASAMFRDTAPLHDPWPPDGIVHSAEVMPDQSTLR